MMASAYEVKQVAAKAKNVYTEIDRRRTSTYTNVRESSHWWSGDASSAFAQDYNKLNNEIHALLDTYAALEKQLKAVAEAMEEAEALGL